MPRSTRYLSVSKIEIMLTHSLSMSFFRKLARSLSLVSGKYTSGKSCSHGRYIWSRQSENMDGLTAFFHVLNPNHSIHSCTFIGENYRSLDKSDSIILLLTDVNDR